MSRAAGWLAAALVAAAAGCDEGGGFVEVPVEPGATVETRPDTPGNNLQFNFERADLVESFAAPEGRFVVHFTRAGSNAVPAADGDGSGVPDFVEEVAAVYEEVLDHYEGTLGFRPPVADGDLDPNGGDAKFDVYLVDFAGVGDGVFRVDACVAGEPQRCIGFMTQENDYTGYGYPSTLVANRILGSHEFFHAIQAAYDVEQGSVLSEGTAVWATEHFDPTLEDFEGFILGYLDNPDRPIDSPLPGPVDPFSYGSAIFFKYLEERFGADTIRDLWERCENGANGVSDPYWVDALAAVLEERDSSFADAFVEFATWNMRTSTVADPESSYADGADYPRVKMDRVELPHVDESIRAYYASTHYYAAAPDGRTSVTAALVPPAGDASATDGLTLVLATETDGAMQIVPVDDPLAGTQTIDASGATRAIAMVVNTATSGDSKKPGLCFGTPEEVLACKVELAGTGGDGGGGNGQGGDSAGGGPVEDGDGGDDGGCSCTTAGEENRGFSALALLAAMALLRRPRFHGSLRRLRGRRTDPVRSAPRNVAACARGR